MPDAVLCLGERAEITRDVGQIPFTKTSVLVKRSLPEIS